MSDDTEYQPIIMARPVNLTDMDRAVSRQIGFDLSNPYPGSIQKSCVDCGVAVWVGPRQQAALTLRDDFLICCPTHAALRAAEADGGYDVHDLGNKHPNERPLP